MQRAPKSGIICAPTAGTDILWYWGFGRGASSVTSKVSNISGNLNKASHIFDVLYDGMGTTTIGGTWDSKVPDGYEEFFGESAGQGTWNYATISRSSSYNVYKDALDEQCPIHLQRTDMICLILGMRVVQMEHSICLLWMDGILTAGL